MKRSFYSWTVVMLSCAAILHADPAQKQAQASEGTAVLRAPRDAGPSAAGDGEVVATNFTVTHGTCVFADSSLDYSTSSDVSITLLSNNGTDMTSTRIVPLFAVAPGAFFVSTGRIIFASDFYYIDGGGDTVSVMGRFLRIRVCNDANFDISYAQLTARASAR